MLSRSWHYIVFVLSLIFLTLSFQSGVLGEIFFKNPIPAQALDCTIGEPVNTCHTLTGAGHTFCEWTPTGNQEGPCEIEACFNGQAAPDCGGGSNQPPTTETFACMTNASLCGENTQFCENTDGGGSATIFKHAGVCNPSNGEHDANGCIFLFDNVQSFTGPNCQNAVQPTQQPTQPPAQPTQPPAQQTVTTCNGRNITVATLEAEVRAAGFSGPFDVGSMLAAFNRAACPTAQPTQPPAQQTVTTCNGRTITVSQLESELRAVGYPGPFDVNSMLAAFARANTNDARCAAQPTQPPAGGTSACFVGEGGLLRVNGVASDCNGAPTCPSLSGNGNFCNGNTGQVGQSCGGGVVPTQPPAQVPVNNCFLCDGGRIRRAGQASDCNGAPACPSLASGTNACVSSSDITGQSCGAAQPTPVLPVGATCFLCDGGSLRVAGMQSDCSASTPACPSIGGPFNSCLSAANVTGQACAPGNVVVTPTPTRAPVQVAVTPVPQGVININNNNVNNNENRNSQSQINSQTVNVSQRSEAPVVVRAAAIQQIPAVSQLPKTGLPLVAWALSGLLPMGMGLKKFGQGRKVDYGSSHFLWQKREFDK